MNFKYIAMLRFSQAMRGPRGTLARLFTSMLGLRTFGMASNKAMSTACKQGGLAGLMQLCSLHAVWSSCFSPYKCKIKRMIWIQ